MPFSYSTETEILLLLWDVVDCYTCNVHISDPAVCVCVCVCV